MAAPPGNRLIAWLLRSPLHPVLGSAFALITVTGRRTGTLYSTPINLIPDADGWYVISRRDRTWWRNLRPQGRADLLYRGVTRAVHGQTVEAEPAVEAILREHVERNPSAARYLGIRRDGANRPLEEDLRREAATRVILRLRPES